MAHTILQDPEFGAVTVRRLKLSTHVKLKVDQRGGISISMPPRTPLFWAKSLLAQSRQQVRKHLAKMQTDQQPLLNGELIGKSHRLVLLEGTDFGSRLNGTELTVTIPVGIDPQNAGAQQYIKEAALKALRKQAKAYLTRRLQTLAQEHGFNYSTLRFSNAGTRWGSCSSNGTISLNIWLMQLQFPLIDYVLIHELCHTRQMNHSPKFWTHVETILPDYKLRRKLLKMQRPYL